MGAAAIPLVALAVSTGAAGAGLYQQQRAMKGQKRAQAEQSRLQEQQFKSQEERMRKQAESQKKAEEMQLEQFGKSRRSLLAGRTGGRRQTFFQGQEVNPNTFSERVTLG